MSERGGCALSENPATAYAPLSADLLDQQLRHDLRQSLTSVMVLGTVLDKRPIGDPRVRDYVRQLRREVDWLGRLMETGSETARLVDLGESANRVWEATAATVTGCRMRVSRATGMWVEADEVTLERCLRNLLDNAARAAGPAGEVEVTVEPCAGSVVVEVSDSGPGFGRVPPQQRLGLRSVMSFAADHGGVLLVGRSSLGGALIRLILPSAQAVADAGEVSCG